MILFQSVSPRLFFLRWLFVAPTLFLSLSGAAQYSFFIEGSIDQDSGRLALMPAGSDWP